MTEEKLFNIIATFSEPRSCTIIPSKDKNIVTGHVVFKDPTIAAKVLISLKGAKLESRDLQLIPGVVKKQLSFKSKGYLQISVALAKPKPKAKLIFATARDAYVFCHNVMFSGRARRFQDPSGDLTKPTKVILKLLAGEDEAHILQQIREANLPLPLHVSVAREDIDQGSIDQSRKFVSELDRILPEHIQKNIVHKSVFFDEKIKRGGIKCYFNSLEEIERAASDAVVIENLNAQPAVFDHPVRLEKFFSGSMAINTAIWTMFETELQQVIKAQRSKVAALINQKNHLAVLDLHSQEPASIDHVFRTIDSVIKCTVYTHPKKSLLFSSIGRKRLTDAKLPIQWDRAGTIRIYGRDEERAKAEKTLNEIMEQLSSLVLNETFIIKRDSLKQVKVHFEQLREVAGVEEMRLFGSRLAASGTKESIAKLRETMANAIVVPKKAQERTEDECPICIDTYDEPVTLQVFPILESIPF